MEAHYAWAHIPGISVLGNEELYHNLVILYLHSQDALWKSIKDYFLAVV